VGAYLPSVRLSVWLEETTFGLFADRISDGSIALAVKLPASVIKAIQHDAAVDILGVVVTVGRRNVPLFAVRVHDEPDSPFTAMRGFRRDDEGELLCAALESDIRRLHFFDELSRHVLSCDVTVDKPSALQLRQRVDEASRFVAVNEDLHERAMDLAEHRIKKTQQFSDAAYLVWDVVPIAIDRLDLAEYSAVSETATFGPFRLDAADEGGLFEETVHELADEIYGRRAYRSPRGRLGNKERELTDVLLVADDHLIVIEAKALTKAGVATGDRRGANLKKDLEKAFDQIRGAARFARQGTITTRDGQPIDIPDGAARAVLGIVIVSEMHHGPDWREVAGWIQETARKHEVLINVMDLMELKVLTDNIRTPYALGPLLAERCVKVLEKGTAFGRVRFRSSRLRHAMFFLRALVHWLVMRIRKFRRRNQ